MGEHLKRVTIAVFPRERHEIWPATLRLLGRDFAGVARIIVADFGSPAHVTESLIGVCERIGAAYQHYDDGASISAIRRQVAATIETEYVLFIDNDVLLHQDCVAELVKTADETGAGLVGPVCLAGDGLSAATVHHAGGALKWQVENDAICLLEEHVISLDGPEITKPAMLNFIAF